MPDTHKEKGLALCSAWLANDFEKMDELALGLFHNPGPIVEPGPAHGRGIPAWHRRTSKGGKGQPRHRGNR